MVDIFLNLVFEVLDIMFSPNEFSVPENILFDTEKLTFECSINFEIFENLQVFSFSVIVGLTLCLFGFCILLEDSVF